MPEDDTAIKVKNNHIEDADSCVQLGQHYNNYSLSQTPGHVLDQPYDPFTTQVGANQPVMTNRTYT